MKARVYKALAKAVVLESIRRKDLWVVAILGFLILVSSGALGLFGIGGLEIFVKDLAVSVLGLFSTILAVLIATRMMPEEIKQRTLYPLLARPITRLDLIIGKTLGAIAVSWIAFLLLAALTGLALAGFHVTFEPIMAQYLLAKMMGLVVICGLGVAFSTLMTPSAASTMCFVIVFGSTMISRALVMAYESCSPLLQWVFKLIDWALPQVSLFDLGGRAVYMHWSPVPMWVMGALALYMAVYFAGATGLSWLKFRRQPL